MCSVYQCNLNALQYFYTREFLLQSTSKNKMIFMIPISMATNLVHRCWWDSIIIAIPCDLRSWRTGEYDFQFDALALGNVDILGHAVNDGLLQGCKVNKLITNFVQINITCFPMTRIWIPCFNVYKTYFPNINSGMSKLLQHYFSPVFHAFAKFFINFNKIQWNSTTGNSILWRFSYSNSPIFLYP